MLSAFVNPTKKTLAIQVYSVYCMGRKPAHPAKNYDKMGSPCEMAALLAYLIG